MSGSPKHCRASLQAERERQLRAQRARQAELERQRRIAEEHRRRVERMQAERTRARSAANATRGRLDGFAGQQAAGYVRDELDQLQQSIQHLVAEIDSAADEEAVQTIVLQLEQLKQQFEQVAAQGEALRLSAHLASEERALEVIQQQFSALDSYRALKFDAAGYRRTKEAIDKARQSLRQKALAEGQKLTALAKDLLVQHRQQADQQFQQWQSQRSACLANVRQVQDQLAGLTVDPVVCQWQHAELQQLQKRAAQLEQSVEAEQFAGIAAESAAILQEGARLVESAQDMQLKEDRRSYIVHGIVNVLSQMGFVIHPGTPAPEHAGYPQSATLIQARRIAGGALAVSVPQEGEIWYSIDGFPQRLESTVSGTPARTCDEAQQQIEQMHNLLQSAFGIDMSELSWEGKDPTRNFREAMRLPETTQQQRSQTR